MGTEVDHPVSPDYRFKAPGNDEEALKIAICLQLSIQDINLNLAVEPPVLPKKDKQSGSIKLKKSIAKGQRAKVNGELSSQPWSIPSGLTSVLGSHGSRSNTLLSSFVAVVEIVSRPRQRGASMTMP